VSEQIEGEGERIEGVTGRIEGEGSLAGEKHLQEAGERDFRLLIFLFSTNIMF